MGSYADDSRLLQGVISDLRVWSGVARSEAQVLKTMRVGYLGWKPLVPASGVASASGTSPAASTSSAPPASAACSAPPKPAAVPTVVPTATPTTSASLDSKHTHADSKAHPSSSSHPLSLDGLVGSWCFASTLMNVHTCSILHVPRAHWDGAPNFVRVNESLNERGKPTHKIAFLMGLHKRYATPLSVGILFADRCAVLRMLCT